ncbi:MAG: PKD domain-containing protein, partial [Bacteroidota bacterium]
DGLGLSANYSGYDPFNVAERNITDAVAIMNTNINTVGRFGITLEFDYQSGGWLGDDYGTIIYSVDGGGNWLELGSGVTVNYTYIDANNNPMGVNGADPAAPPNVTTQNAFSNIDGFSSGAIWHRASVILPATCDNIANLRLGFRWRNIDQTGISPDYVGVSFNIDNLALRVDPPVADFSANPAAACVNEPVTFDPSASTPGGGASITDYIWTFSGGTPATSTAMNPVVTWSTIGMDTVTLQVVNNLGDTSLVASQYFFINDCAPRAEFDASTSVCQDSTLTFTDLSTNMTAAFAPTSWNWTFTGGTPASATGQGPHNVTFSSVGPTTVTLSVTNNYGTDDTTVTINVVDCSCGALTVGGLLWSEDFDGNSGAGSRWVTAPLNQDIGTQGPLANIWYISDEENGNTPPACGSAGGGNQTLHMGSTTAGDLGAAYDIGCMPGCLACDLFPLFCLDTQTDKRSFSQDINTTGQSGLTLSFDYIEDGEGVIDNATVEFSTNGGASWNLLVDPPKTPLTACLPQGTWTAFSIALPASCENISNLRIAFRWVNDASGTGSDPSFAVNNVRIDVGGGSPPLVWEGDVSNDWNVAANWSTNAVPTAADNVLVPDAVTLTTLCPGCVMPEIYNANAEALDVCNYGTITIHDAPTKRTLTVFGALLNEGAITTTSVDPQFDVLMRGAASTYAGTGTNIDTDYQIQSGQTTLLSDISCRTFQISADFDWDIYTITVKRNFYRTTGSVSTALTSTLVMDGPGTGLDTNPAQELGSNVTITIPNWIVNKSAGTVTLSTAAVHSISQQMTIFQGIVDQQTNRITGTADLVMTGGEFRISRLTTTFPALTGNYSLSGGLVQLYGAGNQRLRGSRTYYDLELTGTGVKELTNDVDVIHELYLTETFGLGNYVDAGNDVLHVLNSDPNAVTYSGGHVVGDLRRAIDPNGIYRFDVGSDGD